MTLLILTDLVQVVIMLLITFIRDVEPETFVPNTFELAFVTPIETTNYPNATVGPSPTDSNMQSILPPATIQPNTDSSITSATFTETTIPNASIGPSPTDSNMQSILPPATTQPNTDSSIANVSSSIKINEVEKVGSVKRCKEKITTLFNTMHDLNLQTKCDEIKIIIAQSEDRCLPWLARYIVTKRISIESNYNKIRIYLNFLNLLNNENLTELITLETETNIKALLSQDRLSPMYRKTLNKLGSWYGMVTLAKNKRISTSFVDLKILLIKAYQGGENMLMYTLPFVTRILGSCAKSTVFNSTSPWTLDILSCLNELYQQPYLKLTLQFEIELLYKKLKIDLKDLNPATTYFSENS